MAENINEKKKTGSVIQLVIICALVAAAVGIGILWNPLSKNSSLEASKPVQIREVKVHVKGEVVNPGIYTLSIDSRNEDAVKAAGGFTENADENSVNLAAFVRDGYEINVYAKKRQYSGGSYSSNNSSSGSYAGGSGYSGNSSKSNSTSKNTSGKAPGGGGNSGSLPAYTSTPIVSEQDAVKEFEQKSADTAKTAAPKLAKINLNTATVSQLTGIGMSSGDANAVISYRKQISWFSSVSDILNVPEISEQEYYKFSPKLTV